MRNKADIAPELVRCVADGRVPTPEEIARVAERIGAEIGGSCGGRVVRPGARHALSRRAAHAALEGSL